MTEYLIIRAGKVGGITSQLSFKLGELMSQGLFKNYPENFNAMMPELSQAVLSLAKKVDLDKVVGDWHYYQENCGNYPANQMSFSQYLESLGTQKEQKK